jgi:hypothetical protein
MTETTHSRKFVSYNTSYVNDAHYTQVLGNVFMSESAAVVRKAMKLTGIESHYLDRIGRFEELNDFFKTEDKFPELKNIKDYNNKIVKLITEDITVEDVDNINVELLEQLGYLRMCMADAVTKYIKTVLEGTPDCVALIEQMIHVPEGHQAFYGGDNMKSDLSKDFDNSAKNKGKNKGAIGKNHFFGILRRINILKILGVKICDIDFDKSTLDGSEYYIVYDNVVNISTINFGAPAPAEGIALIVKKTVCPELFEWNVQKLPLKSKLNRDNNTNANYSFTGNVHYYSDDFGNVVSSYKTKYNGTNEKFKNKELFRFRTSTRGTPDLGRPIILTAGINGDDLNIFVALHNANLFNLAYLGDSFYDSNSNFNDLLTQTGDVDGKYVTGQGVNYEGESTKARKLGDIAKENPDHPDLVALYSSVIDNIGVFITNALSLTLDLDKTKSRKINLYLGGDFNDPKGGIFKLLTKGNRLPIKIKIYDKEQPIYIQSEYDEKLISCCANLDSQTPLYQRGFDKALTGDLKTSFDRVVKDDTDKNYDYPSEFIDHTKFGYFGDYAFIGSQINPPISSYQVKLDDDSSAFVKFGINSVMASDHLPVYATVTVAGGGRRRRYSMRVLKRHTKKGIPKKIRASRRKRRSHTYKKH